MLFALSEKKAGCASVGYIVCISIGTTYHFWGRDWNI
jgi:hypothetical protein